MQGRPDLTAYYSNTITYYTYRIFRIVIVIVFISSPTTMSKFSTLVALSALFAPAAALQPVLDGSLSLDEEFDAWAKHYGKAYPNAGHRSARKAIYAHARAFVIDHNQVRSTFFFFFFFLLFSLFLSLSLVPSSFVLGAVVVVVVVVVVVLFAWLRVFSVFSLVPSSFVLGSLWSLLGLAPSSCWCRVTNFAGLRGAKNGFIKFTEEILSIIWFWP